MNRNSAIFQMLMGIRGNMESIVLSQEYHDLFSKFFDKYKQFREKYADNAEMLALFDDLNETHDIAHTVSCEDTYLESFSFGVLMGIDIMQINSMKNH